MFLNKPFPYNTSSRVHVFIGISLGAFILFILFFLKPFNSGNSNFPFKVVYFVLYGLITFFTYYILHLFSILYYKKIKVWKVFEEIIFCLVFISVSVIIAFYYTEIVINKKPERLNIDHFIGWFKAIFLGFGTILFIITFLLRKRYGKVSLNHNKKHETNEDLTKLIKISSSLKKESFLVDERNLVYVKSENNYVRLFYFEEHLLKEYLLRSSLFNVKKQLPKFIKIHRSYIVNPDYVLSLKGNKQNAKLNLKNIESSIPISQPFFQSINELFNNPN